MCFKDCKRISLALVCAVASCLIAMGIEGELLAENIGIQPGETLSFPSPRLRSLEIRWGIAKNWKISRGETRLWELTIGNEVALWFSIIHDGTSYGFNDQRYENQQTVLSVASNCDTIQYKLNNFNPKVSSTFKLSFDQCGQCRILIGKDEYQEIGRFETYPQVDRFSIMPYCPLSISTINASSFEMLPADLQTEWTRERLLERDASLSPNSLEGFYTYLDSELDLKKANKGGNYEVYLLPTSDRGFDIIYIGGATYNGRTWKEGMLKGRLKHSIFENHYNLEWFDSQMDSDIEEAWGEFLPGPILKLNFPIEKSILRLFRNP